VISPLIGPGQLQSLLDSTEPPVVLDVRWSLLGPPGHDQFTLGHVPGARYLDLDTDLADPPGAGGRHPLPDPRRFAATMRRRGVTLDRTVVVMDGADATVAARAWWLLSHHGHDHVRVLDGGLAAWRAAGGDIETGESLPDYDDDGPATDRPFLADVSRLRVLDATAAAALVARGVLLDARAAARYAGEVEPVDRVAGHIPGAVSAPAAMSHDIAGHFLGLDDLVERFSPLGVVPGTEVGVYCGSGVTAAHTVLALRLIGVDAALYAGSWSGWIVDPDRPVAVGPMR
jgi:thiosulfate/3-mercaptopyruvate sulfurtransferase